MKVLKKNGSVVEWNPQKIMDAVRKSANRVDFPIKNISPMKLFRAVDTFIKVDPVPVTELHKAVEQAYRDWET